MFESIKTIIGIMTHHRREAEERHRELMATLTDLNNAIAAAPQAVAAAVEPIVTAAVNAAQNQDFQPQVDAINSLPAQTATAIQNALAPPPPPAP